MADYTIDRSWLIGTADTCAVRVDDPGASTVHCRIDRLEQGLGYVVSDLSSNTGTRIRDRRGVLRPVYTNAHILPGETLIIGRSELVWGTDAEFIFKRAIPQELLNDVKDWT